MRVQRREALRRALAEVRREHDGHPARLTEAMRRLGQEGQAARALLGSHFAVPEAAQRLAQADRNERVAQATAR